MGALGAGEVVDPSKAREQLDKLLRSAVFADSARLLVLLRFLVDETLEGRGASIKEAVIGNAVYGREPPYDPRIDSTVRVEARRLRRKLNAYYEDEGQHDPIRIHLPVGTYVPEFVSVEPGSIGADHGGAATGANVFQKGSGSTVAIMPIQALTGRPSDGAFADGLTDELIYALEKVQGLRIASRNITFRYKDQGRPLADITAELGVDVVLQGTFRREGDLLRVTIEASDKNGFVLWSDRIDSPSKEHMNLQEQIAATIVSRAQMDTSLMRAMQISPRPMALEARAKIYRARQLLDQQTPAALRRALDLFSEVSNSAADYARGYSGIADCYCDMFRLGIIDHATALRAARQAADRALEMDPDSVEAHTSLATVAGWLERDLVAAQDGYQKALQLGSNARASRLYGALLTILERHDEAERMFRIARSVEPFSIQQDIAESISHYQARRYHLLRQPSGERDPRGGAVETSVYQSLGRIFGGHPDEVSELPTELEDAAADHPGMALAVAELAAWLGKRERGVTLLKSGNVNATSYARAMLAAALDLPDQAIDALEESVQRRELSSVWLRTDARLDRLRDRKRFQALLAAP